MKSRLIVILFTLLSICHNRAISQEVTRDFLKEQVLEDRPERVIPKAPLYIINGVPMREDTVAIDYLLKAYDQTFDLISLNYLDKANPDLYNTLAHLNNSVIILTLKKRTDKKLFIKQQLTEAIQMFEGHTINTAHGPLYRNRPLVIIENSKVADDTSYKMLNMLRHSDISNIAVLDVDKAESLGLTDYKGLVKIRLRK